MREGPCLNLVTALPLSVWQDHLRPLLMRGEVVRLRRVCKALKGVVNELPMDLGVLWENLEAALRCVPAAKEMVFDSRKRKALTSAKRRRYMNLLRAHGGTLRWIMADGASAERLLSSAVRSGALPRLTRFDLRLDDPIHREILSGGMLQLLEWADVNLDDVEHVAAIEHLRNFSHLRTIWLSCDGAQETAFPPFIPPSLKSLILFCVSPIVNLESLLRELPGMLQASGACLEEFQMNTFDEPGAGFGAALAQVFSACSSTLKIVRLMDDCDSDLGTACGRDVVPGLVCCCDTLEVLQCPWDVFSALPATCPTFRRLTELMINGERQLLRLASPAWDMMARLPALATLQIEFCNGLLLDDGQGGGEGEGCRLARAFEAVAGTLRRLTLGRGRVTDLPARASYELGAAIGKLRRLRYLKINFISDGQALHEVARGLAASGGCPELFAVQANGVWKNLEWLIHEPSLIVPSVRSLTLLHARCTEEEALLLCCGLVQAGYCHGLSLDLNDHDHRNLPASTVDCVRAIVRGGYKYGQIVR
jgi:hypothetical protein